MTGGQNSADFQRLIERRRKFIDGLDANRGEINLDIFEDFYPDRAHFVYELLQNAEDAGATEVTFSLMSDRLVCEHDGRAFTLEDVKSITGLHDSTKAQARDKIGKFGVGFKSVFVYTDAPSIRSGEFSFRIVQLILPEPIAGDTSLGHRTRFELPLDSPKKPREDAYAEIAAGLEELDEKTLLFLSSLQSVKWRIGTETTGAVRRRRHSDFHFEVQKELGGKTAASSHFLKFDEAVNGVEKQRVAVAFSLDFLPGIPHFEEGRPLAEQVKIVSAEAGSVAVFFPAVKESSGLRFHLHGPFVPELSRASIKETKANVPLFEQLASLCAECLHRIKDLGLLTPDFLAVLPNPQDQLPTRYHCIRDAIIARMKSHPLTPTQSRCHAAADRLIQAKASLKELLSEEDVKFLVKHEKDPPLWVVGATQRNSRIDNYLVGLGIQDWNVDRFSEVLRRGASTEPQWFSTPPHNVSQPDEKFMAWLANKSPEWLQQLYALLQDEIDSSGIARQLKSLKIVRLQNGAFVIAARAFFGNDNTDDHAPTVDAKVYSTGKSKSQQEKAKKFLSELGVRELGESEEIELILKDRYTKEAEIPDGATYLRDLRRFIALTESQPERKSLFSSYYIFQGEDGNWYTPARIYLDRPFKETDLVAYYGMLGKDADHVSLHQRYKESSISTTKLGIFAEAVGARTHLKIVEGRCRDNPQWDHLRSVGGDRYTSPIDQDYYVAGLDDLLKTPSLELSRLIWCTLISTSSDSASDYLQASYRRSYAGGTHHAPSRLVHDLRTLKWVPQDVGSFVCPADASRELLPEGFPFDPGYAWLKAIQFGAAVMRASEQERYKDAAAKSLGFSDARAAERARRFAELPLSEQEKILDALETRGRAAIPDREPANPWRHAENVRAEALIAPDKESEIRSRSVSIGIDNVKEKADEYLRQHYRNADGEMTCQICKGPLPFKLDNGSEYFETVEFLPELRKRHHQNYLALCPNHSAMYMHANGSREGMRAALETLTTNELAVVLAQQDTTIYFSKTHILDLKAISEAERGLPSEEQELTVDDAPPVVSNT